MSPQPQVVQTYWKVETVSPAEDSAAIGGGLLAIMTMHLATISADAWIVPSGYNALSAGPVTIDDGVTVTISDGSTWSIV